MYFEVVFNAGPMFVMRSKDWGTMALFASQFLSARVRRLKALE